MTDVAMPTEPQPPAAEPTHSEKLRIRQAEAIQRQQAKEERKHQDAMEEYRLRWAAQKKDIEVLPNGQAIEAKVKGMSEDMEQICKEIDFNEPDQGHPEHLREALEALIKNYKNGIARFKALPFLENEDMLMTCVGELMECKTECREIIEDLDQLFDLVYVKQSIHVWYQELKKDCENLYHMRTTRDLLFRTWLRGFVDRDESKEKEGGLQKIIKEAFTSQDLEMPDDYRIKSKEEREKEYEEELKRREEGMKKAEDEAKADEAKKEEDGKGEQGKAEENEDKAEQGKPADVTDKDAKVPDEQVKTESVKPEQAKESKEDVDMETSDAKA